MHALIVDDHPLLACALALELKQRNITQISVASSLAEGLLVLHGSKVDFVILDLKLPDARGLTALRAVRTAAPTVRVAVMSGEDLTPEILADVISLGAITFIPKSHSTEYFNDTIQAAISGTRLFRMDVLLKGFQASNRYSVTPRETDVLQELSLGRSNKEIAKTLNLAEATVKRHLESIFSKLGVSRRAQAILLAREHGLILKHYL